jgi:hypothetical protein
MTQEVEPHHHPDYIGGWIWTELEIRWIKERIAEAVLHEREACAKVCDDDINGFSGAYYLANKIRARGQT